MNKVSIIVPIYNVEKYLPDCLNSVLNQTYQNLEIILINDGSTDSCPQICEQYSLRDDRIKVIHQENGGLSAARNFGLKIATGEFIGFIDGDDIIAPEFCKKMLNCLIQNNAEIIECGFVKFENKEEAKINLLKDKTAEGIYDPETALALLMSNKIKQMACNKLFARNVINKVLFEIGKKHEDEFWTYQIIGNAKKIIKTGEVLYFYRQHPDSIMGINYNVGRLDGLMALEERINYMKTHFPHLQNLAAKIFSFASIYHYQKITRHKEIDTGKIFRNKIVLKAKLYDKVSILKSWRLKEILWYKFFLITPDFCAKLRNYLKIGI